jgi:hypothetical protein
MANARPQPQATKPVAASLAPAAKDKPFYKRLWGFGSKDEAAPAPAPVQ